MQSVETSKTDELDFSAEHEEKMMRELKKKLNTRSSTDELDFSAEHEEKMMRELKEEAEKLREENEDLRV